jgi:hypothetical protein
MDKIATLLQSLLNLNKVASVTLPGLVVAVALALIWWPPRPEDRIPIVVKGGSETTVQHQGPNQQSLFIVPEEQACNVDTSPLPPFKDWEWETNRSTAIQNQRSLDKAKDDIADCIEIETSRKGYEKTQNDHLALDIADLEKLLAAALDMYSNYEKSDNPLAARFHAKVELHKKEIKEKRESILRNEQSIRNRDLHLAKLGRYDKIISDRLADPDRLRPRKTFDDLLALLVNHVVAFVLLAIALGVVLTPLNQFASAFFFDWAFPEGY